MSNDELNRATAQLDTYGYGLDCGQIMRGPKATGAHVSYSRGRFRVRQANGSLLFSGSDLGVFVSKFWFAKPVR